MALIRRCARLSWIRTRFIKLNDKETTNRGYVFHLQTQTRRNSQYQPNPEANRLRSDSQLKKISAHNPQRLLDPVTTSDLCYAEVKKLVDKYSTNLNPITQSFGLGLLKSCRDMLPDADLATRQALVQRVWELLENVEEPLTVDHYNVLLSTYAQNSQYLDADEFLKAMKVEPDKNTYRLMLDAIAELGDYDQVSEIMAKIKNMGYPINEATFNSLILAHSVNADVDRAQAVLDTMQTAMIEPSPATYCALSRGFAAKGDLAKLKRVLVMGNLNSKQFMSVLKTLSISGHGEYVSQVMTYLPKGTDIRNKDVIWTIVELTHLGRARDAAEIVNCLPASGTLAGNSSVDFANFFLYEIVKSETPMAEILEICESMRASGKNISPLLKVTETALRLKKENAALLAFQAMQNQGIEIRPHFYWPLLVNAASNKRESDVMRLVKHMIDNSVQPDDETLRNYTIPFLSATNPLMVVRKLQDCGIKISDLLTPLLATLLSNGNLKGAVILTDKITGKVDGDIIVKHLVHAYIQTKNHNATAALLKNIMTNSNQNGKFFLGLLAYERVTTTNEQLTFLIYAFDRKNLKISRTAAEALEPRITRLKTPEDLSKTFNKMIDHDTSANDAATYVAIPHPRNMTLEELENHLADLSTKGMNTRGVLRRLLQAYCGKNNLKKAEEFAQMFTDNGFEWTSGMVVAMFFLYAANNMIDEAEVRYNELKEKHQGFKIDDYKIIDFATALVKNNKWERALEVLGEQNNIRCRPETIRNCWRLLNAVAATGNSENIERTLDVLIEKGYCEISNHVLGPLVRVHLISGNLQAAVAQFKECTLRFRETPLQQELVRAVVQSLPDKPEAREQLTEVLAAIKSIHGDDAANLHLFMALAATDKQKELHALIKMPAVNQMTLKVSAQKLTDEKDLSALQTILKSCRGVHNLDTAIIYDSILTLCSRSGDYATALEVWEKMQIDEVAASQQFVRMLTDLLRSHNVPLPPELIASKGKRKG